MSNEPPRAIPICSRCSKENDRPEQRYCAACHATYMREWRKTHRLSGEARKRDNARSHANYYKQCGVLTPEPCRICGASETEMHHPDHELPLVVVWLCRKCHLSWHAFWRSVVLEAWAFWDRTSRDAEAVKPVRKNAA